MVDERTIDLLRMSSQTTFTERLLIDMLAMTAPWTAVTLLALPAVGFILGVSICL